MQRVAQDWLVLTLTGSGVALGIATALQFGPLLVLGLWAGAVVDRLNRRRLIIVTQTIQAVLAATLAVLTLTGTVELWMVYALALALGIVNAFDTPARQAFVGEMVEPENYVNAQALSSTIHNAGRLVGPAIAGILIATTDVGVAFAVNAVSFVGVLIGLLRIDAGSLRPVAVPESGKGAARAGLRYVLAKPELRATLLLIGVIALFGQNFRVVLPLLAQDTFQSGAEVYGYLTAALGLGRGGGRPVQRLPRDGHVLGAAAVLHGLRRDQPRRRGRADASPPLTWRWRRSASRTSSSTPSAGRCCSSAPTRTCTAGCSRCTGWSSSAPRRSAGRCSAGSASRSAPAPASSSPEGRHWSPAVVLLPRLRRLRRRRRSGARAGRRGRPPRFPCRRPAG